MKISRKELIKALNVLSNGLEINSMDGHDVIVFNERGLHTGNGIVCVSYPFDLDFKGAVNGGKFIKLINKFKGDEIEMTPNEAHLQLKCGRNRSKLVWQDNTLENTITNINSDLPCLELPEDFTEALTLCNLKDTKNALSGVMVANNKVYATDVIVASSYKLEKEIEEDEGIPCNFWLTQTNLSKALKLNDKITHYSLKSKLSNGELSVGTYLRLRTETDVIFSCPLGDFDEVSQVVDSLETLLNGQEEAVTKGSLPSDFKEALGRVSQLSSSEEDKEYVSLEFTMHNLVISSESHLGSSEEALAWKEEINIEGSQTYNYPVDLLYSFIDKASDFTIHPVKTKRKTFYALMFENNNFKHLVSSM